jgi:hypothetical protein
VLVVLARCPPEVATAYQPWVHGIGELARAGDEGWRARLAAAAGGDLCALVPELAAVAGPVTPDAAVEGAQYRVLRGIGEVLAAALGEDGRLLIVLDDAHWCDVGSVQGLKAVLDSPAADRLSLIVTARDRELGRRHPVTQALNEFASHTRADGVKARWIGCERGLGAALRAFGALGRPAGGGEVVGADGWESVLQRRAGA